VLRTSLYSYAKRLSTNELRPADVLQNLITDWLSPVSCRCLLFIEETSITIEYYSFSVNTICLKISKLECCYNHMIIIFFWGFGCTRWITVYYFLRYFPMLFMLTVCSFSILPLDYAMLPSVVRGYKIAALDNYCCWYYGSCAVAVSRVAATA